MSENGRKDSDLWIASAESGGYQTTDISDGGRIFGIKKFSFYDFHFVIVFPNEFAYSIADALSLGTERSGTKFARIAH